MNQAILGAVPLDTIGKCRTNRNPLLLFRLSGELLLRFAGRQFLPLLFQLPPRKTRFEPFGYHPKSFDHMQPITQSCRINIRIGKGAISWATSA